MLFGGLWEVSEDYLAFIQSMIDLGLDPYVQIPPRPPRLVNDSYNLHGLPVKFDPQVRIEEWVESRPQIDDPVLVKVYHTPAGPLRSEVRKTFDWHWGDHVPFLDDSLTSFSLKFMVEKIEDLPKLDYLLISPTPDDVRSFQRGSKTAIEFARTHDLLLVGGWGVGADMFAWIFGLQNMFYALYDSPEMIAQLIEKFAKWNRSRMDVVLKAGVDLYIKRAWHENCDFWTPTKYRQYLAPILKEEVDFAHQRGARFGYIVSSNCMPLLEIIAECGVDVLIGVDPLQWDLAETKRILNGRVCLWGGVNGSLTMERGQPTEVRQEVKRAAQILAPGGGFILSPVDNVRDLTDQVRENVLTLIDEWKKLTSQTEA
jgi:hypothetical protein